MPNFSQNNPSPEPGKWSYLTFSELSKFDVRQAYEFRWNTMGDAIPESLLFDSEKEQVNNEASGTKTVEEIKEDLKNAGVKFHHKTGDDKIIELAKSNNLI
jgi:hypothetical protein